MTDLCEHLTKIKIYELQNSSGSGIDISDLESEISNRGNKNNDNSGFQMYEYVIYCMCFKYLSLTISTGVYNNSK